MTHAEAKEIIKLAKELRALLKVVKQKVVKGRKKYYDLEQRVSNLEKEIRWDDWC